MQYNTLSLKKLPFSKVDGIGSVGIELDFQAVWLLIFDKLVIGPCQSTLIAVPVD